MLTNSNDLVSARESSKGDRDKDRRAVLLMKFLKNRAITNYDREFRSLQNSFTRMIDLVREDIQFLIRFKNIRHQQMDEMSNTGSRRASQVIVDNTGDKKTASTFSIKTIRSKNSLGLIGCYQKAVVKLFEKDRKDTYKEPEPMKDHSYSTRTNSGAESTNKFEYRITQFNQNMKMIRSETSRLINLKKKADEYKSHLGYQFERSKRMSFATKSESSFRPPATSRSKKASLLDVNVHREEMSAPVESTAIGTERSATVFKTSRSQFGKKHSLPNVERSIFKKKSFARLSIWN